jgi:hypothetical protein
LSLRNADWAFSPVVAEPRSGFDLVGVPIELEGESSTQTLEDLNRWRRIKQAVAQLSDDELLDLVGGATRTGREPRCYPGCYPAVVCEPARRV